MNRGMYGAIGPTPISIAGNRGAFTLSNGITNVGNDIRLDPTYAGTRVLLNTLTASSSTNLADTTSLTSTYKNYEIVFENILPATTSTTCQLRVNSGGVQSTTYLGIQFGANVAGAITNATSTTTILASSALHVSNSGTGIHGFFRVYNPSQTATPKMFIGTTSYTSTTGSIEIVNSSGYWNGGNGAVTGFEVTFSSGNIASGIIRVYAWN